MKDSLPNLLHRDTYIDTLRHAVLQLYTLVWVFSVVSDAEFIQIVYVHIKVHFECNNIIIAKKRKNRHHLAGLYSYPFL